MSDQLKNQVADHEDRIGRLEGWLDATDSAAPEPSDPPTEGPKVVGYVREDIRACDSVLSQNRDSMYNTPVILQSEHEAVVRELRERVRKVEEEGIGCRDCDDKGWKEDRVGRYVCACVEETEVWQDLKAENERLNDCWNESRNEHRAAVETRKQAVAEVAGLECALKVAANTIESLEAERDAYADPKNWEVTILTDNNERPTDYSVRYIGPSDSTEAESVEGAVRFRGGNWTISHGRIPDAWPEGTPVRITKIPQTGGNE